jgi:hypothetical protein
MCAANLQFCSFLPFGANDLQICKNENAGRLAEMKQHSLRVGWRNFFSSCAVVSVFGSSEK